MKNTLLFVALIGSAQGKIRGSVARTEVVITTESRLSDAAKDGIKKKGADLVYGDICKSGRAFNREDDCPWGTVCVPWGKVKKGSRKQQYCLQLGPNLNVGDECWDFPDSNSDFCNVGKCEVKDAGNKDAGRVCKGKIAANDENSLTFIPIYDNSRTPDQETP